MNKTTIEWTDASWNPIIGCEPVTSGCKNCWAARQAHRGMCDDHAGLTRRGRWIGKVRLLHKRLDEPYHWKKPRRVAVALMGDLFHDDVPDSYIDHVFAVMADNPKHTFQILTKRPARMQKHLSRPGFLRKPYDDDHKLMSQALPLENVWLGFSASTQDAFDNGMRYLPGTPAAVRWVSLEPMLGQITLTREVARRDGPGLLSHAPAIRFLDWVVAGGESGPGARPSHPDWYRTLRDQCLRAGVPFLFKQWGAWGLHDRPPKRGKYTGAGIFFRPDGSYGDQGEWWEGLAQAMDCKGKHDNGRELDGRTWDQYPCENTSRR